MLRPILKVSPDNAVNAGSTVVYTIPNDRRYFKALFRYQESGSDVNQATLEAGIENVKIYINDKLIREATPRQILDMYSFYGQSFVSGRLPIFFSEPWRRNAGNDEVLAWSMGKVTNFRIELKIASGATSPTLPECFLEWDQPRNESGNLPELGLITKWIPRNVGVTSTGDKEVLDLPTTEGLYSAVHCQEGSAGDINSVKVESGQRIILDTLNDETLEHFYEMENPSLYTPVADNTVIKFDRSGKISDALDPSGKLFKLTTNMANGTDFVLLNEIIGPAI